MIKAFENGLSKDEIVEVITHLAFYSGWLTAVAVVRKVFTAANKAKG